MACLKRSIDLRRVLHLEFLDQRLAFSAPVSAVLTRGRRERAVRGKTRMPRSCRDARQLNPNDHVDAVCGWMWLVLWLDSEIRPWFVLLFCFLWLREAPEKDQRIRR